MSDRLQGRSKSLGRGEGPCAQRPVRLWYGPPKHREKRFESLVREANTRRCFTGLVYWKNTLLDIMYKATELITITNSDGSVQYAVPNHRPMKDWNDFTIIDESEVEFDEGITFDVQTMHVEKGNGFS